MRRRLDLASCLIGSPEVLFLDEPTVGLDPASRIVLWSTVRGLVDDGMTVLLTTQYLDEADWLADEVAVIESGRTIAAGTPEELKRKVGEDRLEVQLVASAGPEETAATTAAAVRVLTPIAQAPPTVDKVTGRISVQLNDGAQGVGAAAVALRERGRRGLRAAQAHAGRRVPQPGRSLGRQRLTPVSLRAACFQCLIASDRGESRRTRRTGYERSEQYSGA
jgi:ABC-2 type transport system ATP-binding protein